MVQGMSRDAWDEFSKTVLVKYVLSYLCGTLYLDPSASLERIFVFSTGGLLALQPYLPELAFAIFSPPLKNFHVVFPTKKCLLCFLSLALDLYCPFSR